jgi:alanyl-tRNA synthetase
MPSRKLTGSEVRSMFLRYFEQHGHKIVHSSSLVPANDPTLLFTNAGMNQFKDVFLGLEKRDYTRATSSQKCVRAGGKHNDLENVGFTNRHHTFFEMLGNFSFGDYFKKDAIAYAWELVTSPEWYGIDKDKLYVTIFRAVELVGVPYHDGKTKSDASYRIIADHSRAATFLISDGVMPSNEGRGYVLRKILRRAMRHARSLRLPHEPRPVMGEMVYAVQDLMKSAYPELVEGADRVAAIIKREEERFNSILGRGMDYLQGEIRAAKRSAYDETIRNTMFEHRILLHEGNITTAADRFSISDFLNREEQEELAPGYFGDEWPVFLDAIRATSVTLPGEKAFKLYDTWGLPRDFIEDAVRDAGMVLDFAGFDASMEEQRARARASWKGGSKASARPVYQSLPPTVFEGYHKTLSTGSEVLAIIRSEVDRLRGGPGTHFDISPPPEDIGLGAPIITRGQEGEVILDHTPFYADAGGQVGDVGWLYGDDHNTVVAEVEGCDLSRARRARASRHCQADHPRRRQSRRHGQRRSPPLDHAQPHRHASSARRAAQCAGHAREAGGLAGRSRPPALRLLALRLARRRGAAGHRRPRQQGSAAQRSRRGHRGRAHRCRRQRVQGMALFGEKYGDRVRVIRIGDFSTELCGGTHTAATGEIGLIKILKEGSVSSGVRRLEAVTGEGSLRHFRKDHQLENVVATLVRGGDDQSPADALKHELERREDELKKLRKELEQVRMKSAASSVSSATENVREVKGVKVLATRADNLERTQLRVLIDNLRNKLGSGVVVLGSVSDGKRRADCRRHQRPDITRAGGKDHRRGREESGRLGRRASRHGRGRRQRSRSAGFGAGCELWRGGRDAEVAVSTQHVSNQHSAFSIQHSALSHVISRAVPFFCASTNAS